MSEDEFLKRQFEIMLDATRRFSRSELDTGYFLSTIDGLLEITRKEDEEWGDSVRRAWDVIEVAHAYQLDEQSKHMRADHADLVRKAIVDLESLFLKKLDDFPQEAGVSSHS